jgi:lipopolysaccharide/colanic/teichoic acid biosynthesis glycosyltransferase
VRSLRAKRALDLAISIPALIVSLPVQAAVGVAVARRLSRPVLFRQRRPGLHGEPFTMLKFRSMLPVDPARGWVDDESRMTDFGRRLRATSLDELPALWNVVRGDMSLVGPRPLLMHYLPLYSPEQARRHDVKPGLTGLAQVSGRNAISWEAKLALDVHYVDTWSLGLDLKILLATVRSILRREGITAEGHVTTAEFTGSASGTDAANAATGEPGSGTP